MKCLIVALAAGLCSPLAAQTPEFSASLKPLLADAGIEPMAKQGVEQEKRQQALGWAMDGMNDGVDVGGAIVHFVKERSIAIGFADQAALSSRAEKSVTLSWNIAPSPRAIAARVAWEVSEMILQAAEMPACAEKEYMRRSMAAHAWIELGGEPENLPFFDSPGRAKDEELAKELGLWRRVSTMRYDQLVSAMSRATRQPSLLLLREEAGDPSAAERYLRAEAFFQKYLVAERTSRKLEQ